VGRDEAAPRALGLINVLQKVKSSLAQNSISDYPRSLTLGGLIQVPRRAWNSGVASPIG